MQDAKVCLLLLSAQQDSFMRMADAARQFRSEVNDSGALQVSYLSLGSPQHHACRKETTAYTCATLCQ